MKPKGRLFFYCGSGGIPASLCIPPFQLPPSSSQTSLSLGPHFFKVQRRASSGKRKTQFFSVATNGPCQPSQSQPTVLPAPTGCRRRKHLPAALGWAPLAKTWGGWAPQRPRRVWGRSACSRPPAGPQAETHREDPRAEVSSLGPGPGGGAARSGRFAPPRRVCRVRSPLASSHPPPRSTWPRYFRRGPARPRPASGLPAPRSLRAPSREPPARLAPLSTTRAQYGALPGPRVRASVRGGHRDGGRGSER